MSYRTAYSSQIVQLLLAIVSLFLHSVHRKKRFTNFPSPAGMSLTKLPLGRNNSVMTSLFPPRQSLVVTSRLGTGNSRTFFLRCMCTNNCIHLIVKSLDITTLYCFLPIVRTLLVQGFILERGPTIFKLFKNTICKGVCTVKCTEKRFIPFTPLPPPPFSPLVCPP